MKVKNSLPFVLLLFVIASCTSSSIDNKKNFKNNSTNNDWNTVSFLQCDKPIDHCVVIELFSSESCYDCPSAEVAFNQVINQEFIRDKNVITLATHVDYWNDLIDGEGECNGNWIDRFSNAYFTVRQFAYAKKIGKRPGTPQIVINGQELISDPGTSIIKEKISQYLDKKAIYNLCLTLNKEESDFDDHTIAVDFKIDYNENVLNKQENISPQLLIFLAESHKTSKPDKGENCGEELIHDNIARSYNAKTIRAANSGIIMLSYPEDVKLENCKIMGFIQDLNSLDIIGGTTGFYFTNEK